jgi:predicted RNase H-like nuclease (RuvC/YqgF family)
VYALLDLAWDNYTAFCNDFEHDDVAKLVAQACVAATQAVMPSCAAVAKVEKKLEEEEQEARMLRTKLCNAQRQLENAEGKAERLQTQLKSAEVELKAVSEDKARETRLLDELWQLFKTYMNGTAKGSYCVSYRTGQVFSADLKKRLPDLK